jgi:hypothetical protein
MTSAPITFLERPTTLFQGQKLIGIASLYDLQSNTPPNYGCGTNDGAVSFIMGQPLARSPAGRGFILAKNDTTSHLAVGLCIRVGNPGEATVTQLAGVITLPDWTAICGTTNLVLLGDYYLDAVAGMLTLVPPVLPAIAQLVGKAMSAKTMNIVCQVVAGAIPTAPDQIKVYVANPNIEGIVPDDQTKGAIAYSSVSGAGPLYFWNRVTLIWE